jgi:hypothetical protein
VWRENAYSGGITASDKPSTRRTAFERASTRLIADGHVGQFQAWMWLP